MLEVCRVAPTLRSLWKAMFWKGFVFSSAKYKTSALACGGSREGLTAAENKPIYCSLRGFRNRASPACVCGF